MLILAIDTSCANAGVCLMRGGNMLGTVSQADKRTHSVKLLPEIQALMESHGVAPAEPDLFAVTVGINAKQYKLDVLAGDIDGDGYVLSLIDARNLRAYGRLYRGGRQLTPGAVDKVTALIGALPEEVRG